MNFKVREAEKRLMMALDPIHIGTGAYTLSRVDMTIVREPSTKVPKIPGTSLAGAIRSYYEDSTEKAKVEELFGSSEQDSDSKQSFLRFYDSRIVLFPVNTASGVMWITTLNLFKEYVKDANKIKALEEKSVQQGKCFIVSKNSMNLTSINLGWLYLSCECMKIEDKSFNPPVDHIVIVEDKVFSTIINDNLEVRTSVKIDRETGAAEDGALFTYEAIPRGTYMSLEISSYRHENEKIIEEVVGKVSKHLEYLGIGGKTSRGFGRVKIM